MPSDDVILDEEEDNTDATVLNSLTIIGGMPKPRNELLAVSHFYHLPRIKMTYEAEAPGLAVYTVPVRRQLVGTPKYMVREVAALWDYYFKAMTE